MGKAGFVIAIIFAVIFLLIGFFFLIISLNIMWTTEEGSIFNYATGFEIFFFIISGIFSYVANRAKPRKKFSQY